MNKVHKYEIPLWPNRYVYFSTDPKALTKVVKKETGEKIELHEDYYGETWYLDEKDVAVYVNKKKHKTKKGYIITVAHECHHAAYAILKNIGEEEHAEEIACRLQDWMMKEIL